MKPEEFLSLREAIQVETIHRRRAWRRQVVEEVWSQSGQAQAREIKAQRAIVQTDDSYRNKIDTVFVDQRGTTTIKYSSTKIFSLSDTNGQSSNAENGSYLVICCDGNASFYENGIFQIPVENGFSTLGWNYPGFGQSTVSKPITDMRQHVTSNQMSPVLRTRQ